MPKIISDNTDKRNKTKIMRTNQNKIFLTINSLYVVIISLLFYFSSTIYTNKVINIPAGSVGDTISHLNKQNQPSNILDNIALRLLGSPQKGWIDIKSTKLTRLDFLNRLTSSRSPGVSITLIPGETYYFFLKTLSKKLDLSYDKLQTAYDNQSYKLDGNILADTYTLPLGMTESRVIYFLLSHTEKRYEKLSLKIFKHYNKTNWYRYVSIASVIQKEAASKQEMPIVSSVIHNRLKLGMRLQMDGTLNYGKYSHTKVTAHMIDHDKTSYNTYKNTGIPKHPVCAVGFDAIRAAIKPANTDYLFFVKIKNQKKHKFSKTHKQHNNMIQQNKKIKLLETFIETFSPREN
ncbi:MAG: endolytic transglycosylase MltG [Epsilonproteobacteria bacterium]|nr:MAG: endolytic transglycosylase MltG [Campylobacterota bacterium]